MPGSAGRPLPSEDQIMLNRIARDAFDEHLKKAAAMPSANGLGAENELGQAAGLIAYAVFCDDIDFKRPS